MSPPPRIVTVVASAGTGKTTRIVEDIAREVERRDPEQLVATTFTVKAADEIIERARARLFAAGRPESAAQLLGARFGTVNSICARIVAEHAFELQRSPETGVIPEGGADRLLRAAAVAVFERHAARLNALGERFGHEEPRRPEDGKPDWRSDVLRLIELGRANGLDPEGLRRSGERSIRSLMDLLAPVDAAAPSELDQTLMRALEQAAPVLDGDLSAAAQKSADLLRRSLRMMRRGEPLIWPDWARLTKIKAAKKDGPLANAAFDAVATAASAHPRHPRLQQDLAAYIEGVFDCAAESLAAFQQFKAERGLLDFIDQEALALQALRHPDCRRRLSERIGCVFVDEFQDSSPLQLAVFMALAELAERSAWVGDPKQAIYGFRNADTALTQAAFDAVRAASGAPQQVLSESWRSRKEVIDFANAAFGPAFAAMGLPATEHAFTGTHRDEAGFTRPPLAVWRLQGTVDQQSGALAGRVREILGEAEAWPVGKDGKTRALQAGDVAVLCRSHSHIAKAARALVAQGLNVAVEREGLADAPHVQLIAAALRWIADSSDRLALAELARFFADDPQSEAWLEAAAADRPDEALRRVVPIADALQELREGILMLTPAELVDAVLRHSAVQRRIESWGDAAERLDDLEALRGFAGAYEETCGAEGLPATLSGLILALEADPPQRPRSLRPDAVQVMTYHGAKGLEWPLVILTGLDREPSPRLFEPVAEADGAINLQDPLAGRWIRFWPWPYGSVKKDVDIEARAAASKIGQQAERKAREEETRLLYVGVTRARDYLVLAPPEKGERWLDLLDVGASSSGHIQLPKAPGEKLKAGDAAFVAEALTLSAADAPPHSGATPVFVARPREIIARPPLRRRPSDEETAGGYEVVERTALGPRLPLAGHADMEAIGNAVHAVLAADGGQDEMARRLQRAKAILDRWKVFQLQPADVLAAADRLEAYIRKTWPGCAIRREVPLFARLGDQLVSGRIDMLVERQDGAIVIDHKSYPGSLADQEARAASHGAQLALYARASEAATGRRCNELYIHMALTGLLLRVAPTARQACGGG